MKNRFLLPLFALVFFFTVQSAFSQLRFQEGYYVNKNGKRVETRIENKRWTTWSNDYLLVSEDGKTERIPINEIREFGIDDDLKFITATVEIEKSSDNLEDMNGNIPPDFVTEEVLLKVLMEGKYSLYVYVDDVRKFFYREGNGEITQLVRKRYKVENEKLLVMEDNIFRKQLDEIKYCEDLETSKLNYEAFSLKKFFLKMNKCEDAEFDFIMKRTVKPQLDLSVSAGIIYSNVYIDRSYHNFQMNTIAPTAGLNLVYKIPLIYNEVGFKLSGIYNSIETESVQDFPNGFEAREITFSHSEFILGASGEYIFFTGNNSAIYGGAGYYFPILLEDTQYIETVSRLNLTSRNSEPFPGLYLGYQLSRFDIKLQYFLRNNNVLTGINRFEASMDQIFLSLGYSIF